MMKLVKKRCLFLRKKNTNLHTKTKGDFVNLEFDQATITIVDTTERLINQKR